MFNEIAHSRNDVVTVQWVVRVLASSCLSQRGLFRSFSSSLPPCVFLVFCVCFFDLWFIGPFDTKKKKEKIKTEI